LFKTLKMGLLNVTRNKRRTLITVSMITFGMIVIIFTGGFLGSISSGLQEYLIESDTGELQIMAKGYKEKKMSGTLDYTIKNASKLLRELAKEPEIAAATERIAVGGLISNGNQSVYCWGTAVNLKTVHKTLPKLLVANNGGGNSLILNLPEGAVIGAGLAGKLGVTKGQTLVLVAYDKYGGMNAVDITITDIAKYAMDVENDAKIITTVNNAQKLLGFEDEATEISLKLKDRSKLAYIKKYLTQKYGTKYQVNFYSWTELMGFYAQTIGMFQGVQFIVLLIMAVVVLIGVINTILMSVFERTSEIGTLMAIGSSRRRIINLFMAESFWIGLTGIIFGAIIGSLLVYLTGIKGIPFSAPGTTQVVYVKPILKMGMIIGPAVILLLISILAGIYPSRYAAKLDPIEAIRKI
jgi:putative ABC transport system permease protein